MISLPIFTKNMKFFAWSFLNSPKFGKWKKFLKIWACKERKKQKTWRGCFSQTKLVPKKLFWWMLWYLLFEHLWKTPPSRRKLHPKSEKKIFYKYLTCFLDAAGWPNIRFLSSLSLSMFTKKRCSKLFWNKMSMIDNRSFRPPQTYLEYLDTDKMRGWAYKSIWNIWTRKKWEAKLKILNEMQMLHLPLKLSHSALIKVWWKSQEPQAKPWILLVNR